MTPTTLTHHGQTGPRTPEGKAKSRKNAMSHGGSSHVVVLAHEDAAAGANAPTTEPAANSPPVENYKTKWTPTLVSSPLDVRPSTGDPAINSTERAVVL